MTTPNPKARRMYGVVTKRGVMHSATHTKIDAEIMSGIGDSILPVLVLRDSPEAREARVEKLARKLHALVLQGCKNAERREWAWDKCLQCVRDQRYADARACLAALGMEG